jgi:hypothetical protein
VLASVNQALVWLTDLALGPLMALPPLISLLIVSIATAALMVPVIARTSNQARVAGTKRRIQAALLEIRLYNDDPRAVLRALGEALRGNALYLGLSLVPLAWMALPLILIVAQLQQFYGYDGLAPGEPALVKVAIGDAAGAGPIDLTLEAPAGMRIETGPVQLAAAREVLWRVVPEAAGAFTLRVRDRGDTFTKTIDSRPGPARRSPFRVAPDLIDQLLYPSEPPVESPRIGTIAVSYREATVNVLGWQVHWMIVYVVLSMAAAFAIARRRGVVL